MTRRHFLSLLALVLPGWALAQQATLKFSELYSKVTVRGIEFSPKLKNLSGQRIQMSGFMAPPLKPKLDFFVLTREPMSTCPFCTTAADWPADIVLVIMPDGQELTPDTRPLRVTGRLEVGIKKDETTGFVSLVRLYADRVQTL
jgi:hypothetical protein